MGSSECADAVLGLWDGDGNAEGDRSAARRELQSSAELMTGWYAHFAASLAGAESVPDPLPRDEVADGRLVDAVGRDLRDSLTKVWRPRKRKSACL